MSKGISNIEIEKLFKEINKNDLNENFLSVHPSDKINKFIMFFSYVCKIYLTSVKKT